ncbi:hypothetical protein RF11_09841 [Thelohanellus kitauei]|uniref:Uncharacterized protein n=1 Tax=Thelohanellus kitauei TaxID=669202 RepID=A0A0C2JXA0_THEKT|nr:hypothetical protein RF11_09841 [Thelohanellus kitauei]
MLLKNEKLLKVYQCQYSAIHKNFVYLQNTGRQGRTDLSKHLFVDKFCIVSFEPTYVDKQPSERHSRLSALQNFFHHTSNYTITLVGSLLHLFVYSKSCLARRNNVLAKRPSVLNIPDNDDRKSTRCEHLQTLDEC